ncbi:MAG: response regulator [Candidatus Margulisiibacteriota bacterium]
MNKKILIVDDDKTLGDFLEMTLKFLGEVEVERVLSGEEGVLKAAQMIPDLIVMDYKLPGINGWEAAKQIKANPATERIPIIGYTAWASKEDIQRGLQQIGLAEIMTKPVDIDVWEAKLNRYIEFSSTP